MTIKTITAAYPSGYTLKTSYTGLSISSKASVGGTGVHTTNADVSNSGSIRGSFSGNSGVYIGGIADNSSYTDAEITNLAGGFIYGHNIGIGSSLHRVYVENHGVIGGEYGIKLTDGGKIGNYNYIYGADGVIISGGQAIVYNTSTIFAKRDGVIVDTGFAENGKNGSIQSLVCGMEANGAATIVNLGTIADPEGAYGQRGAQNGISLTAGGMVTNGSVAVTTASIVAQIGISALGGTVNNYGLITDVGVFTSAGIGVTLHSGADLNNGSLRDRVALIDDVSGVITDTAASMVSNFATIEGRYGSAYDLGCAVLLGGGRLTNGAPTDTSALIQADTAITVKAAGTVTNFGSIVGTGGEGGAYGILFTKGGRLANGSRGSAGALVEGYVGVEIKASAGSVANFGTIEALGAAGQFGVYLYSGSVTNGGLADSGASVLGYSGIGMSLSGTVSNYGTVSAGAGQAVNLAGGGKIVNGAATDQAALIRGAIGVRSDNGALTVANFGTIVSTYGNGVQSYNGGQLTNGSASDHHARIAGQTGVYFDAAAVVTNYATISGLTGAGVETYGGQVTNGAGPDTTARIEGVGGVLEAKQGTVTNLGVIDGETANGVYLLNGGSITNGGGTNQVALIEGETGVRAIGASASVKNFGTVLAGGNTGDYGVYIAAGGSLTNGSVSNSVALIEGYGGVDLQGAAHAVNFGAIRGQGDVGGAGAVMGLNSSLTNGSMAHPGAVIEGYVGAYVASGATLINFGAIVGQGGEAVELTAKDATLVVEAGSSFVGAIDGGGGILELGTGTGTLTGLLSATGNVTVSGGMATTTFNNFNTVKIDAPASFTLAGNGAIAAGQALVDAGTLAGTGTLALTGGTSTFNAGAALTVAKVTEAVTATVTVATNLTYAGVFTQSAGTVSVSAGDKLSFSGAGDSFLGTLAGTGTVAFTGGTDALTGTTLKGTSVQFGAATITLSGAISNASAIAVTSPSVIVAAAGATLSGTGSINLSNLATNEITGAAATATLTNVSNKITGAGLLGGGKMTLINQAGGTIYGNQATALTIDTGTATIANAGIIENTGTGGTIVKSAVSNTGTLEAIAGTITFDGAVTGTGTVRITAGTTDFVSTFAENVAFATGATGTLELGKSQTYTGSISGFSKTGTNFLDLADIAFTSGTTKASFSGTTTSGVLTVTDGTHTAKITLTGNYTTSTFVVATDGHGGTLIHDPAKAPAASPTPPAASPPVSPWWHGPAPLVPFIGAMAGFGSAGAGSLAGGVESWRMVHPALTAPRAHIA